MLRRVGSMAGACAAAALLGALGCDRTPTEAPAVSFERPPQTKAQESKAEEHAHKPGAHGGIIVEIGRDNYHAEAVLEESGALRLYTLGKDEARVQEVESQTLTAYVKPDGAQVAVPLALKATPQPDDTAGKTSQFVAQLPDSLLGKGLEVTVPSIKIAGERFRFGFTTVSQKHEADMPGQVADDQEKKICLTPGGKYTLADIQANGNVIPSQKYRGVMFPHADAQPGDMTCPIGKSKATPKCTWIIAGKTYQFC